MSTSDLPPNTRLAADRTRLAYERTLMAWVRTATSLISFGFTIYKFFDFLREGQSAPPDRLFSPREFALLMIGTGIVALLLAATDHRRHMQALRAEYGPMPASLSAAVAVFVGMLGLFGLVTVFLRL